MSGWTRATRVTSAPRTGGGHLVRTFAFCLLNVFWMACKNPSGAVPSTPEAPAPSIASTTDAASASDAPGGGGNSPLLDELLRAVFSGKNGEEMERTFEKARAAATPAERPFVERARKIVTDMANANTVRNGPGDWEVNNARARSLLQGAVEEAADFFRDAMKIAPDDVSMQVTLIASLFAMPQMASAMDLSDASRDAEWQRESVSYADRLLHKYPSNANVQALRGHMCVKLDEDPISCLRPFANCREAAGRTGAYCKDMYALAARDYTSARCTKVKSDVGLYIGTKEARVNTLPMKTSFDTIHIDARATFSSADIASVEDRIIESTLNGNAETEEVALLTIRPERQDAFATWLEHAPSRAMIVVRRARTVLAVGMLGLHRRTKRFHVRLKLADVCDRIEQRSLPSELPSP